MQFLPFDRTASKIAQHGYSMRDFFSMLAASVLVAAIAAGFSWITNTPFHWSFLMIMLPTLYGAGCLSNHQRALANDATREQQRATESVADDCCL